VSFSASSYARQSFAADWGLVPLHQPSDIDPNGHMKHDGWWIFDSRRLPCTMHGFMGYQVPVFEPDIERWWYDVCLRKQWRRPTWLLASGVAL